MLLTPWLRSLRHHLTTCRRNSRRHLAVRPCLESLEDRRLLSASALFDPGWVTSSTTQNGELLLTLTAGQQADDGQVDVFEVQRDGNQLVLRVNGVDAYRGAVEVPTSLAVQGSADQDTFIVNADALPWLDLNVRGSGTGDRLQIQGGIAQSVTQQIGPVGGAFVIDGSVLRYDEIDEVADSLAATSRTYQFSAVDAIGLTAVGGTATIATAFQSVSFALPTRALTLDTRDSSAGTLTVGDVRATTATVTVRGDVTDSVWFDGDVSLGTDLSVVAGHVSFSNHLSLSGTLDVQASTSITVEASASIAAHSGSVLLDAGQGTLRVSGRIDVSGDGLDPSPATAKGGTVHLLANDVRLLDVAQVDAGGHGGGGTILVGGDFQGKNAQIRNARRTAVGRDVRLSADALTHGDGGKVIVWADGRTDFAGTITARGGSEAGNGGLAETSGKETLVFTGFANLSAVHGTAGRLLLDPKNITIATGGGDSADSADNEFGDNPSGDVTISAASITAITNTGTAVELQANNNITIDEAISTSSSGTGGNLIFRAGNSIFVNQSIFTDDGNLTLSANDSGADSDFRDAGDATIEINAALNAGAGTVSITINDGSGLVNNSSGKIHVGASIAAAGGISIIDNGTNGTFRGIKVESATLSVTDADLVLTANVGGTGTFSGIELVGATLTTSGTGSIRLTGQGSNDDSTDLHTGVLLSSNTVIQSTASGLTSGQGEISIMGTGGRGTSGSYGLALFSGASVSTVSGDMTVQAFGGFGTGSTGIYVQDGSFTTTGVGGLSLNGYGGTDPLDASGNHYGILLTQGAAIRSTASGLAIGQGKIRISALGGVDIGNNRGLSIEGSGTILSTVDGDVSVNSRGGIGTQGSNVGITIAGGATVETTGAGKLLLVGYGGIGGTGGQVGLLVSSGATVRSTGTGFAGDAATLELVGYGGNDGNGNSGVVVLDSATTISSVEGELTLTGYGGNTSGGTHVGVQVQRARIQSTGIANVSLFGFGGGDGSDVVGANYGVLIQNGALIESTSSSVGAAEGLIHLEGSGGRGGGDNRGVALFDFGTTIRSQGGNIELTGVGGSGDDGNQIGIINLGAQVVSFGSGTINLNGTGGSGGGSNGGVLISDANGLILSASSDISIHGSGGSGTGGFHDGVVLNHGATVRSITGSLVGLYGIAGTGDSVGTDILDGSRVTANANSIQLFVIGDPAGPRSLLRVTGSSLVQAQDNLEIRADSLALAGTQALAADTVTITSHTGGRAIDLGSDDSATQLGLTNAELRLIASPTLEIGSSTTGGVTVSNAISPVTSGTLTVYGTDIVVNNSITSAGTQLNLIASHDLTVNSDINGSGSFQLYADRTVTISGDIVAVGTGAIAVTGNSSNGARNIVVNNGLLSVVNGDLLLDADRGSIAGTHIGVSLTDATLRTSGSGTITIFGHGGDDAGSSSLQGIALYANAVIESTSTAASAGGIELTGVGGAGTFFNSGIATNDSTALIQSAGGFIDLAGYGAGTEYGNFGVFLGFGGQIIGTGDAIVHVNGAAGTGTDDSAGVSVFGTGSRIATADGEIQITGFGAGTGARNVGVGIQAAGKVQSTGLGEVRIFGTGGSGTDENHGVLLEVDQNVVIADGNLSIEGYAGNATGIDNVGVVIRNTAAIVSTGLGEIAIEGHGNLMGSTGNKGVVISNLASVVGAANITIEGFARDGASGSNNTGLTIDQGASVGGTGAGTVLLEGYGALGIDNNYGVQLNGGTLFSSGGGDLTVRAFADAGTAINNFGLLVENGALIDGRMTANVSLTAYGGDGAGSEDSHGLVVRGSTTEIVAEDGSLSLEGHGGNGGGSGTRSRGILLDDNARVHSVGSGLTYVTGFGGNGNAVTTGVAIMNSARLQSSSAMFVTGHGGSSTGSQSIGVLLDNGGQILGDGLNSIILNGYGGGNNNSKGVVLTGAGSEVNAGGQLMVMGASIGTMGDGNNGVEIVDGARIVTHGQGSAFLSGHAGAAADNNVGILISGTDTAILTENGGLSLSGFGGNSAGTGNDGIRLVQGAVLTAMGSGGIELGGFSDPASTNLVLEGTGTPVILASGGVVVLTGDSQSYTSSSGPLVSNATGTVVVRTRSATTLQVGGTAGADTLLLGDAQLDLILADRLVLNANEGTVNINDNIDPALAANLAFVALTYHINADVTTAGNLQLFVDESSLTGVVTSDPPVGVAQIVTDQANRLQFGAGRLLTIGDDRDITSINFGGAGIVADGNTLLMSGDTLTINAAVTTTSGALTLRASVVQVNQDLTSAESLAITQPVFGSLSLFLDTPALLHWGAGPFVLTIGDQGRTGSVTVESTLLGERNFGIGSGGSIFTHLIQLQDNASANLVAGQLGNSNSLIGPFEAMGTGTPNVAFTGGGFNDRVTTAPSTVPFFIDGGAGQDTLIIDYDGLSAVSLSRNSAMPGSGSVSALDGSTELLLSYARIEQFGAINDPANTLVSASIQGTVFVDYDGDGGRDDPMANVVFELYDAADPMNLVLLAMATSDMNGVYFFEGLLAGDYIVRAQADPNLYFTLPVTSSAGDFEYFVHVEDGDASIFNDFTAFILNGATVSVWDGGGDGINWSNAANWVGDVLPGLNSEVFIDAGMPIHIDTNVFVHGLHVDRDITLDAGFTLFVNHTSQVNPGSRFEALAGSTIVVDSDDASFHVYAGRLVAANIQITNEAFASIIVDEYAFPPSGPIGPVGAAISILADTGSQLVLTLGAALNNTGALPLFIQARAGSTVELTTPSITGAVSAFASETGSVMNLRTIVTFTGPAFSPSPLFVGATQGAQFFAAPTGTTFSNVLLLGSGDLFNPLILGTGTTFFGNGFVNGPVTVAPGATDVSVSASGSGSFSAMLVFQDDLLLDSGVTFGGTLHGLRPGLGYSIIAVSGTVALNNATLSFSRHGFTPRAGDAFTIIDNLGSGAVVGTFAGLAEGAIVLIEGQAFSITYAGGAGGNNVVLTAFDQPTIVSISQEGPRVTGADSVSYLATFSGAVTGVDATDFYVYHFGSVAAGRVEVTALTTATYRVTLSGITGSGNIGIQFQENGSVHDLNGASLLASGFSPQFLTTGNVPAGVIGADINGDGFADILTANNADNNLSVFLNNGSGSFFAAPSISIGMPPGGIAVGDLNGDGFKDLVVTITGGSSVAVLYGTGLGNFDAPVFLPTGNAPTSVILADLNHDNRLDIVAANVLGNTVSVLLANGLSFDPAVDYAVGAGPLSLVAADVTHDGEIDLAVVNRNDNTISLLAGNGDGMFGAQAVFSAGSSPYSATSLAVGDLNDDGLLDFVTANEYDNTVSVLLQDVGGMFTETMYSTITRPQSVSVGDFNRDGRLDVAVAGEGVLAIMPGDGTGALVATQPIIGGGLGNSFAATADLDNDGDPDLMFVDTGNLQVGAVLNLRSAEDYDQGRFFGSFSYIIDGAAPTITAIARQNPAGPSTTATSLTWLVTFSEDVTGVALSNFSAVLGGSATGSVTDFTQVNGSQYTVTVTGVSGTGSVTLQFTDSGMIQDLSGNHLVRSDGQPALEAPVQVVYDTLFANATEVADFDGDGNLDLISVGTLGEGTGAIEVSLGNGDGTFQAANSFSTLSDVSAVVVGDLNHDGNLDFVVTNSNSSSISVFLGNGDGTFAARLDFATGVSPFGLAIGDVNGDGILDVVVTSLNDNNALVLLGVGDGTLTLLSAVPVGMAPKGVELADLNGDGLLDLVVANAFDATVSVALGNGDGTFQMPSTVNVGSFPFSVAVADLNGDGIPDLAVSNYYSDSVSVLLGAGDGSFAAAVAYGTGVEPYSVAVADLNGDGIQDLLVANSGDSTVGVLLGNGDGTFKAHQTILTGSYPVQALTADINGDGRQDVVALNSDDPSFLIASTISILLGADAGTFDGQSYTLSFGTLKTFIGTVDGSLSNAANWLGNVLPDLGDDILINSPVNRTLLYDLPPGAFFGQITFTGGGAYTLSPSGSTDVTATNFIVTGTTTVTVSVTGVLSSSAVFTADAGSSLIYTGTIVGMGTLILDGLGSKTLAASNAFSGTTFVQAGDATIANPGAVPGPLTAGGSSTVHLGSGSNSALAHVGDLNLSFSTLQIDINGDLPDETYDQLQVTGTVTLGTNAILDVSRGGYLPTNGTEFILIDNDGTSDAVIGTFSGLTEGSTVFVDNKAFVISYVGGDGNDVTLTAIATTRVWDGGGLTGLLSDPLNWVGDIAPLLGDNLQFPAIAGNHALINDLVGPGMGVAQVERIGLQDSYTFTGLALSVTTLILVSPGTSSTFNLPLTLGTTGLQVQAGSTLTLAGGIDGGSFLKTGDGTLALGGIITLTGSSTVSGGTLLGAGAIFIDLPSISLLPGTTLAGTGVDGASVTVSGGTVSPGMSPGQLFAQEIVFSSGPQASSLIIELNGPLASDQDNVNVHSLTLGNVALDLRLNFVYDIGTTIRLVTVSGPDPVSGQFTNFAEGQRLTQSGRQYRLTYIGGDGNDIELQVLAPDVGDSIDQALLLDLSNIFANSAPGAPATVTFTGQIDDARDTDFFVFTATRSGLVEVRQNSPVLNSFLFIYNSQRQLLAYDNDSGGGGNSAVRFQVERGRQYFIRTTAVGISTGAYNLVFTYFIDQIGDDFYDAFDVTQLANALGNLQLNVGPGLPVVNPISGGILPRTTIDFAGDVDVLRYVAQVTGRLTVTQSRTEAQTGLDSVLDAFRETSRTGTDASAVFLTGNDDFDATRVSQVTFNIQQGQAYYIRVSGFGATAGNWALSFQTDTTTVDPEGDIPADAQTVTLAPKANGTGDTADVTGSIDRDGDVDYLQFTPSVTGQATVLLTSPLPLILDVFSGSVRIASDRSPGDGTLVTFDVIAGQTYFLRVATAIPGTPPPQGLRGAYSLRIETTAGPLTPVPGVTVTDQQLQDLYAILIEALVQESTRSVRPLAEVARAVNTIIVQAFINQQGGLQAFVVPAGLFYFDPVDFIVTESAGRQAGFTKAEGVVNEFGPKTKYTGDGAAELLIIPNITASTYNLQFVGVGAGSFLAGANFIGARGGVSAVTIADTLFKGTTSLLLDFSGRSTGVTASSGPNSLSISANSGSSLSLGTGFSTSSISSLVALVTLGGITATGGGGDSGLIADSRGGGGGTPDAILDDLFGFLPTPVRKAVDKLVRPLLEDMDPADLKTVEMLEQILMDLFFPNSSSKRKAKNVNKTPNAAQEAKTDPRRDTEQSPRSPAPADAVAGQNPVRPTSTPTAPPPADNPNGNRSANSGPPLKVLEGKAAEPND